MNILEFIKQNGQCRSESGHHLVVQQLDSGDYPIVGHLLMKDFQFPCRWTEDGLPENLPTNHGLALMPTIPQVYYKSIDKKHLAKFDTIEHLMIEQTVCGAHENQID